MAIERAPNVIPAAAEAAASQEPRPRLFTVDEYYKMAEVGILRPDERVQLIEGKIVAMPAIGPRHAFNVTRLARLLRERLAEDIEVRTQQPIHMPLGAEPEPDVAVVQLDPTDPKAFELRHPTPAEALLVIEVADTTLAFDLGEKAFMYARHAIRELWVVDLHGHEAVVHREPTAKGYASVQSVARGTSITPLAFPDVTFTVDEILG